MHNLKYKRAIRIVVLLLFGVKICNAQQTTTENYSLVDNLQPVTPTMRQFTKYTDLPVSEYTGVPNISVPIYEIDEDGVKIPFDLTYNASGIKVNEDASWVGLGWDMTVGSIVQQINDQDDFESGVTHLQSDYLNTGTPLIYPYKYNYCLNALICNSPCQSTIPVTTVNANFGMPIYTGQWAPFNGSYSQQDYLHYFDDHVYYKVDSEPDVFTANFCGHSFKFITQWYEGSVTCVVLDKKGYQVTRTGSTWIVVVPSGEIYTFNELDPIQSTSYTRGITGDSPPAFTLPSSNIWMLTKITTKNKKVITFNYTQTATKPCYPQFSQRGIGAVFAGTYSGDISSFCMSTNVGASAIVSQTISTTNYSSEKYTYLSSVSFPNGSITFNLSGRNDINGGLKLDSLAVSTDQVVKLWKFNYSYFNSTGVGGNMFTAYDTTGYTNYTLYRLKLNSVQDNSGAIYNFTYNSTPLPVKNSFATDYWGYYNGDLSNSSFVLNSTQFKQTGYPTNSDNHSANLPYTQAGILQQVKYPTGGTVNFTYALNQFNNYWVPDYASNTNTVSSGLGLRVQSVIWKDATGNQLQQTNYNYSTGLASIPINFFREYPYGTVVAGNLLSGGINWRSYNVYEINMGGNFTANPFASFNGVGYSQVTKTQVDNLGNTDGKTISNYYNTPDLVYNSISIVAQIDPTLPAFKNPADTAENGSLKSEYIYDSSNNLLKTTVNTYTKSTSALYPAARIFGYGDVVTYTNSSEDYPYEQNLFQQNAVGYYPMYDFETLLAGTTETDYFGSNAVTTTNTNTYDSYNQLSATSKTNSTYTQVTSFTYPYDYPSNPVLTAMTNVNRLTDIVTASTSTPTTASYFSRSFEQIGSLFFAAKDSTATPIINSTPFDITTYDQYDASNGNILQYTKNTVPNSILWDYDKENVIAMVKNALYTNVAYTSFEADGTGRWKFTGTTTPDPAAPTGQKVYSLSNGNIYRDSLNTTLTYVVSYWSKNGAQTVSGSGTTKQGYTFNGYTYYETTVTHPTSGTITVSGTGTIDELRLYPNTAQMKSFTYAPLVGVTSESNEGGKIAYYEYDYAMRLLDIRDQNKNILKAYCYNYAGQLTNCGLSITYSSQAQSQSFTRNNCSSGYVGSSLTYTVPQAKYTSTMSLDDANNQATEDMSANGQANANTNGVCVIPPSITQISYAGHGTGYTQILFNSITGCVTTIINYKDLTTNTPYTDVGSCSSPRFETLIVGHNYQFTITCYATAFPSGLTSAPYNYTPTE